MARVKAKNPLVVKICAIILIIAFVISIIILCVNALLKREIITAYDLGEKSKIDFYYEDKLLTSYEEYRLLLKEYNLAPSLEEKDFNDNYYLASFQEYDSCSEKKPKRAISVENGQTIKVTFKIYNKCGFCAKHIMLHLVKMDKIELDKQIEYEYVFASKNKNCGLIK